MSEFKTVQELKQLDPAIAAPFRSIFILRRKTVKTAKNGNPYLSVELGDAGGNFTANAFSDSAVFTSLENVAEGSMIRLSGKTEYYQDRFSPRLQAAEEVAADDEEAQSMLSQLVEVSPESEDELWSQIEEAIASIEHLQLRETVQRVMDEMGAHFRVSTAAISMHHAYRHGLLEHTAHMVRVARCPAPTLSASRRRPRHRRHHFTRHW